MVKKKLRPFLVTWGLFVLIFGGIEIWDETMNDDLEVYGEPFGYTFIAAIYSGLVLGLYGIPVSLFSDWITKNRRFRPLWAFLIHAGFGLTGAYILGAILATSFWLADEFFKWRDRRRGV